MNDRVTFEIETGYGQTIRVLQPAVGDLFVLEVLNQQWDKEGEQIVATTTVRCVLDPATANRLAVALYHGVIDATGGAQ